MILFETIKYQNFMSVGNSPVTIQLNKAKTTLISAPNGVGKSVLLDAICFALFGKAYRKINKNQLINSINMKALMVEVTFSIGTTKYRVIRGIKPNVFQIFMNDKLINEDASSRDYQKILEQQILKFNYRAFTQVCVMGSAAYTPFMKLETADRRLFIEDLLDIKVFSVMNKILSEKIKENKQANKEIDVNLTSLRDLVETLDGIVKQKNTKSDDDINQLKDEIRVATEETQVNEKEQQSVTENVNGLKEQIAKLDALDDKLVEITKARKKIKDRIKTNSDAVDDPSTTTCPTCKRDLPEEEVSLHTEGLMQKIAADTALLDQANEAFEKIQTKIEAFAGVQEKFNEETAKLREINQKIYGNNILLERLNKELSKAVKVSSDTTDSDKLREAAGRLVVAQEKKKQLIEEKQIQDTAHVLLNDSGIKAKIIRQYIPTINKLVNKYLSALDFFCKFTLDEEFNEVVKSRHRDIFSYDSFSQGEKQRIDLSLIFTWREISAMKNSLHTNLIIMDEMLDSSMDGDGMNYCFDLINKMDKSNVFVVSHREAISDKFDDVIRLRKKNNFTERV